MIDCPNCRSRVMELVACDLCQSIGCIKCITRFEKRWACKECKSGESKEESSLFDMFG